MKQKAGKRENIKGNGALSGVNKNTSKNGKRKKFKNTRLFKILRTTLILLIIVLIVNIVKDLTHKVPEKISLVILDNKIELKNDIKIDEYNNFYMSIDDVKNLYDSNVYYSNKILITTYNKHIAILELGKTTMKVNDVVQEIKGTLKDIDGTIYIPFSDMVDVYDFSLVYNKDEKVLKVDSKLIEKKEAVVLKNAKLKETTKKFAKTIEKVKKTSYVTVFDTVGEYTKVRTKSGKIGYIKTKKISKPEIIWETMDEEVLKNVTILNDYEIVDKYENLTNTQENSIVLPHLYSITKNEESINVKEVIDLSGEKFDLYKQWAINNQITICPKVTLNCNMSDICSTYESRSYVINTLYNNLINNKLTMICIDFSNIDDTEGLYRIITEMVPRFKCAGMKVLIKYNSTLNKDRLKNIVDFVID